MAVKALSLTAVRPYQSKLDPEFGTDGATTFQIGTLDSRIMGKIKDMAASFTVDPNNPSDEVETSMNRNEVDFELCMYGIRGWKNFIDAAGNSVPYKSLTRHHSGTKYDVVDPDLLKTLPQAIIAELAAEISKDNEVSVAEGND